MSGQAGEATSAAYRISGPVPALFHEDPLFLGLCAAFDDLLGPAVTALDCFAAYLDPWLAPGDFLAWLASFVGVDAEALACGRNQPSPRSPPSEPDPEPEREQHEPRQRAIIAAAVRGYGARGTAAGLRDMVATATGVAAEQITIAESGAVTWANTPGTAEFPPFDPIVKITVVVPQGWDPAAVAACARAAAEAAVPVFSQLRIEMVKS